MADTKNKIDKADQIEEELRVKPNIIRQALKYQYKWLVQNTDAVELVLHLSHRPLSDQQCERLSLERKNYGETAQANLLLDYMIKACDENLLMILHQLKDFYQSFIYEELIKTIEGILHGEITHINQPIVNELQARLKQWYKENNYHLIQALPGEKYTLDLGKSQCVMPLEFYTRMKQEPSNNRSHLFNIPTAVREPEYTLINPLNIEEIVDDLECTSSRRLILVTANAGCGKTVLIHKLVHEWMDTNCKWLRKYKLLFTIKIRDVDTNVTIKEILSTGRGGLGYVDESMMDKLIECLKDESIAKTVLVLIDGMDEKTISTDSELYALISGKLYPGVKVIVTARPEAPLLHQLITEVHPSYLVNISGTTIAGVYSFLEVALAKDNGPNTAEIHAIIQKCEAHMIDFPFLQIPLYLTLVAFIFHEVWVQEASFANFTIPKTATELFNAFMRIILRIWITRSTSSSLDDRDASQSINFQRNPLSRDSTIPMHIKRLLKELGKLSLHCLQKERYEFSELELNEYFIDAKEITQSGLLCFTEEKGTNILFFRHKQFQEYFAAMYLTVSFSQDPWLRNKTDLQRVEKKSQTLFQLSSPVPWLLAFIFGLSPLAAQEILRSIQPQLCVAVVSDTVRLSYEARLNCEANDNTVTEHLVEALVKAPMSPQHEYGNHCPAAELARLCHRFSRAQKLVLLPKWCGLYLQSDDDDNWHISHQTRMGELLEENFDHTKVSGVSLEVECISIVLYSMLSEFTFPWITTLRCTSCFTSDIHLLLNIFPKLQKIFLENDAMLSDQELQSLGSKEENLIGHVSTIEEVTIQCLVPHKTVWRCPDTLLQQSTLTKVVLWFVEIWEDLPVGSKVNWPNLQILSINVDQLQPLTNSKLSWLLHPQHMPQIQELSLGCKNNFMNLSHDKHDNVFMDAVLQLKKLKILRLWTMLSTEKCMVFVRKLHVLQSLHTLGLYYRDVGRNIEEFVTSLIHGTDSVNTLELLYMASRVPTRYYGETVKEMYEDNNKEISIKDVNWETLFSPFSSDIQNPPQ